MSEEPTPATIYKPPRHGLWQRLPLINKLSSRRSRIIFVVAVCAVLGGAATFVSAAKKDHNLWPNNPVPKTITTTDKQSIELGVKFKSRHSGYVTGVRFYKGAQNTGTHVGSLWDSKGNLLASVTFKNETSSGWQTAYFAQPVNIAANVMYVVSYHAPNGHYSETANYFKNNQYRRGPLVAFKQGSKYGDNGVYVDSQSTAFPTNGKAGANFWVDLVFRTKLIAPPTAPAPPTTVTASQQSNSIVVKWNAGIGANPIASYRIIRNGRFIRAVTGLTYSLTDTVVEAGRTYTYQIESVDRNNTYSAPSEAATVTYNATPPQTCPAGYTGTPPNCTPPASSGGGGNNQKPGTWWKPGTGVLPWQWEIDHEINTSSAADMGTGSKTPSGSAALSPVVYDIDGINNSAADVKALHDKGKKVICYIEVGSAGNYYGNSDGSTSYFKEFQAAGVMGAKMGGYPEYYLNINATATVNLVKKMIHDQCYNKGFDGVEPDLDDSYTDKAGFTITEANEVAYLTKLSDYAHSLGMAWGLKNGGDGGTPAQFVKDMIPHIDFAVVEEPYALKTINYFYPALYNAGKAMFVAEYKEDTSANAFAGYCSLAQSQHTNTVLYNLNLNGKTRVACQ